MSMIDIKEMFVSVDGVVCSNPVLRGTLSGRNYLYFVVASENHDNFNYVPCRMDAEQFTNKIKIGNAVSIRGSMRTTKGMIEVIVSEFA